MSTIIKFDIKELRKLATDKNSCVVEKKVTQNLALQPWCLGNLKESLKNLLDYKIGKFDKEFNGILLSYKNLRVLQNIGTIRNDNADIHFQVQADYYIFRPCLGATLKGVVNKKSPTHLSILVHRVFNVVVPRPTEEPGNKWIGSGVTEGQEVVFRVAALDLYGALPYIRGELDERCLKQSPDSGDELYESKGQDINVPYINFDKTKPIVRKQIGDGLPHPAGRSSLVKGEANKLLKTNLTQGNLKTGHVESDVSVQNKGRKSHKHIEPDAQTSEVNQRQSKKHRKEF